MKIVQLLNKGVHDILVINLVNVIVRRSLIDLKYFVLLEIKLPKVILK